MYLIYMVRWLQYKCIAHIFQSKSKTINMSKNLVENLNYLPFTTALVSTVGQLHVAWAKVLIFTFTFRMSVYFLVTVRLCLFGTFQLIFPMFAKTTCSTKSNNMGVQMFKKLSNKN